MRMEEDRRGEGKKLINLYKLELLLGSSSFFFYCLEYKFIVLCCNVVEFDVT